MQPSLDAAKDIFGTFKKESKEIPMNVYSNGRLVEQRKDVETSFVQPFGWFGDSKKKKAEKEARKLQEEKEAEEKRQREFREAMNKGGKHVTEYFAHNDVLPEDEEEFRKFQQGRDGSLSALTAQHPKEDETFHHPRDDVNFHDWLVAKNDAATLSNVPSRARSPEQDLRYRGSKRQESPEDIKENIEPRNNHENK